MKYEEPKKFNFSKGPLNENLIISEAFKRGIKVSKSINKNRIFIFKGKNQIIKLHETGKVGRVLANIAKDKSCCKKILEKYNVPAPKGKLFKKNEENKALKFFKKLNKKIVCKPNNSGRSKLVSLNIKSEKEFKELFKEIIKNGYEVLIEEFVTGTEYRIFATEKGFITAIKKDFPEIVGDGVNTLQTLIENKNKGLTKSWKGRIIRGERINIKKINKQILKKQNLTLNSILHKDQKIKLFLNTGNISDGRESETIEDIHPSIKKVIFNILQNVLPGVSYAGVDLISKKSSLSEYHQKKDYSIIEVNCHADLVALHFPDKGKPQNVAGAILDTIFPMSNREDTKKQTDLTRDQNPREDHKRTLNKFITEKSKGLLQEIRRRSYLNNLIRNKNLSKNELKKIQFKKLKKLIIYAYENIPFYREKYKKAGFKPHMLKLEKDILKIPLLKREEIRTAFPNKILNPKIGLKDCTIIHTTGSTSMPVNIAISRKNQAARDAIHEFARIITGCSKKNSLIQFNGAKGEAINALNGKNNRFRINPHSNIDFQIKMLNLIKPDFIKRTPTSLANFLDELKKSGLNLKNFPKGLHITGEILIPSVREKLEQIFKSKVFEFYGNMEIGDVAVECKQHNGMHEIMEHAYIEILNENNLPTKEMESGKVIITDLDNYDMPFIRYEAGDMAKRSYKDCPCGIKSPLIKHIEGRTHDFLASKNGKLVSPYDLTGFLSPFYNEPLRPKIKEFRITQEKDKKIKIEIASDYNLKNSKNIIKEFIKKQLGTLPISIKIVKEINWGDAPKRKFVISKAGKSMADMKNKNRNMIN